MKTRPEDQGNVSVCYLTDEVIRLFADKALTDHRDINGHIQVKVAPYPKGVCDKDIFGSIYSDRCNCGKVTTPGMTCYSCGSKLLTPEERYKRFARIDLPVYYCSDLKFVNLFKFLNEIFDKIIYNLKGKEFQKTRAKILLFDLCQFDYDVTNNALICTDEIDDHTKCSFDGILEIIKKHKPESLPRYLAYINSSVVVLPLIMRPFRYDQKTGRLKVHEVSTMYQTIIYNSHAYYDEAIAILSRMDKAERRIAILNACLREYVNQAIQTISKLLKSSKENLARKMYGVRLPNSIRATIVPGAHLKVTEVELPVHLVYEACRKEFTKFLSEQLGCTLPEADAIYRTSANTDEVQKLFKDFVDGDPEHGRPGKYAIINRAPTLYKHGMWRSKVRLTRDYTMSLPLALCKSLNADFDGDQMSAYIIDDELLPITDKMAVDKHVFYEKNHKPLFMPEQDVMSGLLLASRVSHDIMPMLEFPTLEDAKAYRKDHPELRVYTAITIGGKETTIGRTVLGELFNVDLDDYLENYKGYENIVASKKDHESLTADNLMPLYAHLDMFDDRIERIQKIQEYSHEVSTIYGITAPTISDLLSVAGSLDSDYLRQAREVLKDTSLTKDERNVTARELYNKYAEEVKAHVKKDLPDLTTRIEQTAKSKLNQLMELSAPQLNTDLNGDIYISERTMTEGFTEKDFIAHTIDVRGTTGIKTMGTPESGYLTRQFVYLGSPWKYSEKEDKKNKGILLAKNRALGRVLVETGERLLDVDPSDTTKVLVRSVVTSTLKSKVITSDMLPSPEKYKREEGDNIGISLITSMTEGLTQASLALKHGGHLKNAYPDSDLRAPYRAKMTTDNNFIYLTEIEGNRVRKYIKPGNWVANIVPNDVYDEGQVVGYAYRPSTPTINLDRAIKFTHAAAVTMNKKYEKNDVTNDKAESYAVTSGKFTLDVSPEGETRLFIGGRNYQIDPKSMYFFADGDEVKVGDHICNGLLTMPYIYESIKDSVECFYIFRDQFEQLVPGLSSELIEFFYRCILYYGEDGELTMRSVKKAIHNDNTFFTELSFEYAKQAFHSVDYEGLSLENDLLSSSVLPMLLNSEL